MISEAQLRRLARELDVRLGYAEKNYVNSWILWAIYQPHHVVVGMRDQAVIVVTGNSRRKERHDRQGSLNSGQATTERMAE